MVSVTGREVRGTERERKKERETETEREKQEREIERGRREVSRHFFHQEDCVLIPT